MKKGKKLIALMMAAVFVWLTAASTPVEAKELTASQIMKKAAATSSKIKNYTSKTDIAITMKYNGTPYAIKLTQKMNYIKKPFKAKSEITVQVQGEKQKATCYFVKKGSKVYTYEKSGGKWTKSLLDEQSGNLLINSDPGAAVKSNLKGLKNVKLKNKNVKVSGRKAYVITADIALDKVAQIDNTDLIGNTDIIDLSQFAGKKLTVTYWIDKKTYYPLKCSIDMKGLYQTLMGAFAGSEDLQITKCSASVTYSKINKTSSFKLPSGVK